jgi:hypothetical protein
MDKHNGFNMIEDSMKKIIRASVFAFAFALAGCSYSDGERSGTVTKFSKKGIFCKTWEGELVMGGMRTSLSDDGNSSTATANIFEFSVIDDGIVKKVREKLESGERATLIYEQELIPAICQRGTSYVITGVK